MARPNLSRGADLQHLRRFAPFYSHLVTARPAGEPALPVSASWSDGKSVHINWRGLDRYYMTEGKAPAAETAYREHKRGSP
jgi:hypothetical protein